MLVIIKMKLKKFCKILNCLFLVQLIILLIYYNTAARGLTDIYARLPRARSAQGRVRIYQSNPEQAVLYRLYYTLHRPTLRKSQRVHW